VLLPVSSSHISDDRAALAKECMNGVVMNDWCTALPGHGPAAQSLADSIATWKGIQLGAKIGIGVGVATVVTGVIVRYRDGADSGPARPTVVIQQDGGRLQLGLGWALRF
jgi:hypothetical protein